MSKMGRLGGLMLWLFVPAVAQLVGISGAEAQIYKYSKGDGTVVYTDNLAELPSERRVYYNERQAELEAKAREEESLLGAEEAERRRLEREKNEVAAAQLEEAERRERMAAIDAQIARYQAKKKRSDLDQKGWQRRMKSARDQLQGLLTKFRQKQAEHSGLATKANFALLPGQAKRQDQLAKELERLEVAIDAQIELVEVTLPEQARREGVPPGWLR